MAAAALRPGAAVPAVFREQYAWSAIVARLGLDVRELKNAVRAR
jgi:hypothetical protein